MPSNKTMKVKDLQAILAECDPQGEVSLSLPSWTVCADAGLADYGGIDYGFAFMVHTSRSTAAVDADGKPDVVSIRWTEDEMTSALADRNEAARVCAEAVHRAWNDDA